MHSLLDSLFGNRHTFPIMMSLIIIFFMSRKIRNVLCFQSFLSVSFGQTGVENMDLNTWIKIAHTYQKKKKSYMAATISIYEIFHIWKPK